MDYETWLTRRNSSASTIRQRIKFMRWREEHWGTLDVGAETVAAWLAQHHGWTLCTYYTHLRSVYAWATATGIVAVDPTAGIAPPRRPRSKPRPLSVSEARLVLDAADGDLRAHLMLGLFAGLRAHEIAKFSGEDITEDAIYVFGKGAQGATLPTHPALWALAQTYPRTGWWFPSERTPAGHIIAETVTGRVSRHFAALGVVGSCHRNRHTYGTTLLRGGANLRVVQELMRHSKLETTAFYLGVDETEKRRAILDLAA